MRFSRFARKENGTPIPIPDRKHIWNACFLVGALFWIVAVALWIQQGVDEAVLFSFDANRRSMDLLAVVSKGLSSYGMAVISTLFVAYFLFSKVIPSLDAPLTVYLYTICSYGLSGIAGDLIKEVLGRPRPRMTYGDQILALSTSGTPAIPSGHATKVVALILPFIVLVAHSRGFHKAFKIVIALIAGGVCFSRIVLGAHYVSDVLAGIGTAIIGLPLTMLFANMILRNARQEQLPALSIVWAMLLLFLTLLFMAL